MYNQLLLVFSWFQVGPKNQHSTLIFYECQFYNEMTMSYLYYSYIECKFHATVVFVFL